MRLSDGLAIARLARWQNGVIAALGVVVGAWWAGGPVTSRTCALAALASVGLATFANAFNDVCDEQIDRIAHPERPLPSGALTSRTAERVAWAGAIVGIVLSSLVSPWMGLASVVIVVLMRDYSLRLKRMGVPGNLMVAVLASVPFIYGAWAMGHARAGIVLAAVAAPLHVARELAKDLEDAAGDATVRRTLAVTSPPAAKHALLVAMLAFVVAVIVFSVPRPAAAVALFPATAIAAIAAWRAVRDHRGAPRLFKSAMVLAMLSLFTLDATRIK